MRKKERRGEEMRDRERKRHKDTRLYRLGEAKREQEDGQGKKSRDKRGSKVGDKERTKRITSGERRSLVDKKDSKRRQLKETRRGDKETK
ncbi:4-hydroxy-3-methylbut-2-enyl diphosphate reductase [Dissostichus eleginoides]|uniref:4-hydroxy-3-methylbut-2-enyl diphosphate reductase n=1 Tax=Dissostichus eleginoides TaxID=100907 RepID=A0AAD9C9T7_DISEL|nr:4-hydroxy-3-methylbut-2-enyl diphosphate reductase [Dissostichus eleginoides]